MSMTHKDHIVNILREVMTGGPNPGEDPKAYLERMADTVLSYVPASSTEAPVEEKKTKK